MFEGLHKDDLDREQSINRELRSQLAEKETQLKISERQNEKLKKQVMTTNTLVKIQQEQIRRLKQELNAGKYTNGDVTSDQM